MSFLLRLSRKIDRVTDWIGRGVFFFTLLMILAGAFNASARYLSRFIGVNFSSNAFIELQWYMFSAVFLLGAAYALKEGAHVRVDVLFGRLSPKGKAWINVVGCILFLFPFTLFMIYVSWPSVVNSWSIWEQSPDPGGLPRYPIKTLVPLSFFLVFMQGVSEFIKQLAILRGVAPEDASQTSVSEGL